MAAKTEYKFIHTTPEKVNAELAQLPGFKPILMTATHTVNAAGFGPAIVYIVLEHVAGAFNS